MDYRDLTHVSADVALKEKYRRFIEDFMDESGEAKYRKALDEMVESEKRSLEIEYSDLFGYAPTRDLAEELLSNPESHILAASGAIKELVAAHIGEFATTQAAPRKDVYHARFKGLPVTIGLRDLPVHALDRFVQVKGIVTRVSEAYARLITATYVCTRCGEQRLVELSEGGSESPGTCHCGGKMRLDGERSEHVNWQQVRIQELPEDLPPGAMPKHVEAILWDDVVDAVKPGDQTVTTGVIKLKPAFSRRSSAPVLIYKRYLDLNNVEVPTRAHETLDISPEDEEAIINLSKDPNLKEKMLNSISPAIYGWGHIKEAICLCFFGGRPLSLPDRTKIRGELNMLLVGDPGVAKCVAGSTLAFVDGNMREIGKVAAECISRNQMMLEDGYASELSKGVLSLGKDLTIGWTEGVAVAKRRAPPDLYEVSTESGLVIRVTPNHPFLVMGRDGTPLFTKAEDLRMGLHVAAQARYQPREGLSPPETEIEITPDLFELMGFLIAKARFQKYKKRTTLLLFSSQQKALKRFIYLMRGCLNARKFKKYSAKGKFHKIGFFISKKLYSELTTLLPSLDKPKVGRWLPEWVLSSPEDRLRPLITGYICAAGTFSKKRRWLWAYTYNDRLTHQIRLVLMKLGIVPGVKLVTNQKFILKGPTLKSFVEETGINTDILGDGFVELCDLIKGGRRSGDALPSVGKLIREIRENLKVSRSKLCAAVGMRPYSLRRYELGIAQVPRNDLTEVASVLKGELQRRVGSRGTEGRVKGRIGKMIASLESLSRSDVYWDRIIRIRRVEPEDEWVYDIEVPGSQNFIANGLVIHNSQFLKNASLISSRGLYTTGKGSTAAGLTAAVIREAATGGWTLEAGALVIADGGLASIDEFDKMSEDDRRAIHEAMEQQTVSIAKAGIVATLNARTTILAAANPKRGRYDPDLSVAENINLPPTVLSRFDLIFVIRDIPDAQLDEKIAEHILSLRSGYTTAAEPPIPPDLLSKYIAYSRQKIKPLLSEEAMGLIKEFYLEMRKMSRAKEEEIALGSIAITPRQLEALIRLSEARARMFLRNEVTEEDARDAIELMKIMLGTVGYDIVMGRYDIYGVMTGRYMSAAQRREGELKILRSIQEETGKPVPKVEFIEKVAKELGLKEEVIEKDIIVLREEGLIYVAKPGYLSIVRYGPPK